MLKKTIFTLGVFLFLLLPNTSLALYNPSYIIPDAKFVANGTMTEAQIQAFLVSQTSYYANYRVPAARYVTYLGKQFYEGTWIGPVGAEVNAEGWTAAHVIKQVSDWYGINPQVILVTIQKESSMITSSSPAYYGLVMWTMGYAYTEDPTNPIKNVCDTATNHNPSGSCAGFAMQLDWAGGGLKHWYSCSQNKQLCGVSTKYWAGETITLDNAPMYIGNHSTGALYRYTPHNTYGGNFRTNFTNWFGSIDHDGRVPVYRFYRTKSGTHFYTASEAEKNTIIARWPTSYRLEGVAYYLNSQSPLNTAPLYRFYNLKNGTHFYTASEVEKNNVIAKYPTTYRLEGIAYHVTTFPTNTTPVYRFYNIRGTHFYTASATEKNNVIAKYPTTYKYEGVAFFLAP